MRPTRIELYRAKDGHRWRMKRSGRIVAESGEAYSSRRKRWQSLVALVQSLGANVFTVYDEKGNEVIEREAD